MSLFQLGKFTLSSGQTSNWKIECDALTPEDWQALALMVHEKNYGFHTVVPAPKGKSSSLIDNAKSFANALEPYCDHNNARHLLLVDDVYTTGGTLSELRRRLVKTGVDTPNNIIGIVVFARNPLKEYSKWISPVFQFMSY